LRRDKGCAGGEFPPRGVWGGTKLGKGGDGETDINCGAKD